MPLVKETLKNELASIFSDGAAGSTIDDIAEKLATAIDNYIKSGTVTTTVTTSAGNGTGTGSIS